MFFKLVLRNSRQNRKANLLYFSSMIIAIVVFYNVLALEHQDIIVFLKTMEGNAVNKVLNMIPVLYSVTLAILFFLVYFAISMQFDSRKHEFGVYLTLGMKRSKLFMLMLLEELLSSMFVLMIGLPIAIILSEVISLITLKLVGLDIINHSFVISLKAIGLTIGGFLIVKTIALIFLSSKIVSKEIRTLLYQTPSGAKRDYPKYVYLISLVLGSLLLFKAYHYALTPKTWDDVHLLIVMMILGVVGTILFFYGLRMFIAMIIKLKPHKPLHIYNFRQLQEMIINRSTVLAICSLLISVTVCLISVERALSVVTNNTPHTIDYTFIYDQSTPKNNLSLDQVNNKLKRVGVDKQFSKLFEVRVGSSKAIHEISLNNIIDKIQTLEPGREKEMLLDSFNHANCYFIRLSGYNKLRIAAGLKPITLADNQAALYRYSNVRLEQKKINNVLALHPTITIGKDKLILTDQLESLSLAIEGTINLFTSFIVSDSVFDKYLNKNDYGVYVHGILNDNIVKEQGLISTITHINKQIDQTNLKYESYLKNIGFKIFSVVLISYLTIYLSLILLIVVNTILAAQFLIGQRKMSKHYQTLLHLGATYKLLCRASNKQINWYFGLPVVIAIVSSFFVIKSLLFQVMPLYYDDVKLQLSTIGVAIGILIIVELIYIQIVRLQSKRYLRTLMQPQREE